MKKLLLILSIAFLSKLTLSNEGSGGGGPRLGNNLLLSLKAKDQIQKIDNIELNDQIKYPASLAAKIEFLKRRDVQSIQMIDGTIILNK